MNSEKISIKIIHSAVGEINESDVTLAIALVLEFLVLTSKPIPKQKHCLKENR